MLFYRKQMLLWEVWDPIKLVYVFPQVPTLSDIVGICVYKHGFTVGNHSATCKQ